MQEPHFVSIAARKKNVLFFAPKSPVPLPRELVALLKFWKATAFLKAQVDPMVWPAFVIYAFRRFIIFASAIQSLNDAHPMLHVLPPLDVLWVWHSLLQSPGACYASFTHAGFGNFMHLPFPLEKVGDSIDNVLFQYHPDSLAAHNFAAIVSGYGHQVDYAIPSPFNPSSIFYPVFCPVSGEQMGTVLLALYASPQMRFQGPLGMVTHNILARLQTEADFYRQVPVEEMPQFLGMGTQNLFGGASSNFVTGFFNALPLVHLTVGPQCVKISGDWISHALHDNVPTLVDSLGWLFLGDLESKLMRAIDRYRRFWQVISKFSPELAVPTLDIRMVWSAHLSDFRKYADFSIFKTNSVVVPAQAGAQTTSSLFATAKQFSELFGCSYCQCKCRVCRQYDVKRGAGNHKYDAVAAGSFSCAKHIFELLLPTIVENEVVEGF